MKNISILVLLLITSKLFSGTDFAIPDAPAFAIVQKQPTAILRASNSKELMTNIGAAIFNESLNQNPWGIEYNLNKRLNFPLSISYASNVTPNRTIAFGLRADIINKIEAQEDSKFNKIINDLQEKAASFTETAEKLVMAKYNIDIATANRDHLDEITKIANTIAKDPKYENAIKEAKEYVGNLLWNKEILTLALASSFSSIDGTYEKLSLTNRKVQFWGTYTLELGSMLQVNLNLSGLHQYSFGIDTNFIGVGTRVHYGTNNLKGMLDLSVFATSKSIPHREFSGGLEWNILENYWFTGRIIYNALTDKVIPNIEIKVGI